MKCAQDLQPQGFHGAGEKRRGPVTGHWQERSFLSWTHMVVNFSSATYHQWSWASDLSLQGPQIPLFNENNDKAYLPEWLYILKAQRQQPEGSNYFTLQTIALYREMQSYAIAFIRVNALTYIVIKAPVFGSGLSITYHRPESHCDTSIKLVIDRWQTPIKEQPDLFCPPCLFLEIVVPTLSECSRAN